MSLTAHSLASAIAIAVLFDAGLSAQPPATRRVFEVASIRVSAADSGQQPAAERQRSLFGATNRINLRGVYLGAVIMRAFHLRADQLSAPDWMRSVAYDISAVAPEGSTPEQVMECYRNLLEDRFHMRYHREAKPTTVFALTLRSGAAAPPKGEVDDDPFNVGQISQTDAGATARAAYGVYSLSAADGVVHYDFHNIAMADLAEFISPFMDYPVVDHTGLTGRYRVYADNKISESHKRAAPSDDAVASDPRGASVRQSLEKQGLRLEVRKEAFEKLIVDAMDRTPTEN